LLGVLSAVAPLDPKELERLREFAQPVVTNTRGETVGDVRTRLTRATQSS
jgi:hypothetical protein